MESRGRFDLRVRPALAAHDAKAATAPDAVREKTVSLRVITPVFGGGVHISSDENLRHLKDPDRCTPIRGSTVRGQLRFWWRVMCGATVEPQELYEKESKIWGAARRPSPVSLSVEQSSINIAPVRVFDPNATGFPRPERGMENIAYAAFPLQSKSSGRERTAPGTLHEFKGPATLTLRYPNYLAKDVEAALTGWLTFGGLGGRTRRGFGAVSDGNPISPSALLEQYGIPPERLECVPSPTTFSDPAEALKYGLGKLRRFRQGVGVGRNPGADSRRPGRSRWPEPEAIRKLLRTADPMHRERLVNVDKFPRAAFGLPIIFHFQSKSDPEATTLHPKDAERMASPLILRPILVAPNTYRCFALVLGVEEIPPRVVLTEQGQARRTFAADTTLTQAEASTRHSPLRGIPDALFAFLDFFAMNPQTTKEQLP
ncbi:type III-B CRISPR module RAMP protein Cmr1 [Haliangium sp. UPWRP_2]|uniref:type III-B CRISPR module RAMP protein Cmr1 n=1 Tax=Haliangium sp. UPWRP_2 TaxID=1931276 RepID=UPI001304D7FC|nr:type III-B CRISPR module RAMP protein Cmr1 [Haliangium sp. UPWRP_2]